MKVLFLQWFYFNVFQGTMNKTNYFILFKFPTKSRRWFQFQMRRQKFYSLLDLGPPSFFHNSQ